jgi:hypothetical protein
MVQFLLHGLFFHPYKVVTRRLVPALMFLASFLRDHRHALYSWPDRVPELKPRVALFVHFDRRGAVQMHVRHYLAALRQSGCSVLFVTNAERLQPDALEVIKTLCDGILIRRNIGYDFGALREGIEHFQLPRDNTDMLILANDSVYGPFTPLDDILGRIDFAEADIWGVTDSWQHRYHLQSFFLVAGRQAMRNPAWTGFWTRVRPVASKLWVISRYEVGFTQWMLRAGLRCAAIWPYSTLIRGAEADFSILTEPADPTRNSAAATGRRVHQALSLRSCYEARQPLNPTSDLWKPLLRRGFPFIKRELLRDNPGQVADVVDWPDEVSMIDPAHVQMIEADLKRTLRHTAP